MKLLMLKLLALDPPRSFPLRLQKPMCSIGGDVRFGGLAASAGLIFIDGLVVACELCSMGVGAWLLPLVSYGDATRE